jgi:hypothetical protein
MERASALEHITPSAGRLRQARNWSDAYIYGINTMGTGHWLFKDGKNVRVVLRNEKAFDYPQLLDALKLLLAQHFILKGEIACMANTCSPDFAAIFSCPTLRRRYLSWMKSLCGLQCLD